MKEDGGSAFPVAGQDVISAGMTLRDWFAGQALVGLLASEGSLQSERHGVTVDGLANHCYRFADAMLAERRK